MKIRFIACVTICLSMTTTAQAQDVEPYTGVGIGLFGLELKTPSVNQKNNVLGGFAKFGVSFNDFIAAELRIGTTGKGTSSYPTGTPVKLTAGITVPSPLAFDFSMQADYFISYLIKPQYEIAESFRVYALLGGTTVKINGTFSVAGIPGFSGIASGFSYGAGAEYHLANHLNAGAEWVQYWTDVKTGTSSKARIWGIVGTASYKF